MGAAHTGALTMVANIRTPAASALFMQVSNVLQVNTPWVASFPSHRSPLLAIKLSVLDMEKSDDDPRFTPIFSGTAATGGA